MWKKLQRWKIKNDIKIFDKNKSQQIHGEIANTIICHFHLKMYHDNLLVHWLATMCTDCSIGLFYSYEVHWFDDGGREVLTSITKRETFFQSFRQLLHFRRHFHKVRNRFTRTDMDLKVINCVNRLMCWLNIKLKMTCSRLYFWYEPRILDVFFC